MAASLTAKLVNGILKVQGTEKADRIVIRANNGIAGTTISVDNAKILVNGKLQGSVDAASVTKVDVHAYGGHDYISLYANKYQAVGVPAIVVGGTGNDTIIGGAGNDTLIGGPDNDKIWGMSGDDTIWGQDGNDTLYGGSGRDKLYGGNDDDALFGGGNGEKHRDELWGGSGRDRFLTQSGEVIHDGEGVNSRNGRDAQIIFVDRTESWSDREIEVMDKAFANLFAARGNNKLLKDPLLDQPLTFYQDDLSYLGHNQLFTYTKGCHREGPWWSPKEVCDFRTRPERREIVIDEWNENDPTQNRKMIETAIHEIAHNFHEQGSVWTQFLRLSGWVQNPTSTKGLTQGRDFGDGERNNQGWWRSLNDRKAFARGYGGTNPEEDWATTWELYFRHGRSTTAPNGNAILTKKLQLVDQFIRNL